MIIYFVRHGHPNYELDCLTDIGHLQAEACAKRLKNEGIERIFSSSCGRAIETAEHTAKELGLQITACDFMREIGWGSKTGQPIFKNGHPWFVANDMVLNGEDIFNENWAESDRFSDNIVSYRVKKVIEGFDEWLETLGYKREGKFYRVVGDNTNQTIAMFSHAGSSSAVLTHLLGLPLPWVYHVINPAFTCITIVRLSDEKGTLTFPQLSLLTDAKHIEGITDKNFYGS